MEEKYYTLSKEVAQRLKELREAKNLSEETVFQDTGLDLKVVEDGKTDLLIEDVICLCNYYGITLKDFFKDL